MIAPLPIHQWADTIETHIASNEISIVDRVAVLAETASTQDAARRMAANRPGLVAITARQTTGRGRQGRAWTDHPEHSLAMTLAVSNRAHEPGHLALAAGIALARACASVLPADTLGLKWPNDLVDRKTNRKLAGVLIESAGPLALVGIGVNVSHTRVQLDRADLPNAASLHELGATASRTDVAQRILVEFDAAVHTPGAELTERWRHRDTLTGTHQTLAHDGKRYEGVVEAIDPTLTLVIRTRDGIHRLPALTTSITAAQPERTRSAREG